MVVRLELEGGGVGWLLLRMASRYGEEQVGGGSRVYSLSVIGTAEISSTKLLIASADRWKLILVSSITLERISADILL